MKARIIVNDLDDNACQTLQSKLFQQGYEVEVVSPNENMTVDRQWYVSKAQAMMPVNDLLLALRKDAMRGEKEESFVLIQGESGTGKESIAQMIRSGSRRARAKWVSLNCGNYSSPAFETKLFGNEKEGTLGALEIAKGGTLFLDQLGELDQTCQGKLLGVLQEKRFHSVGSTQEQELDVRIISANTGNLKEKVSEGKFSEDLYQRLCQVIIDVPALRNRSEDIISMARQFAEQSFRSRGKTFPGFAPESESALKDFSWPGNVRELMNVIERVALIWQESGPIHPKALTIPSPTKVIGSPNLQSISSPTEDLSSSDMSYTDLKKKWCDSFERQFLMVILNKNAGNVSAAARAAKLDRSNFLRLLRRHGLKAQEYRKAA